VSNSSAGATTACGVAPIDYDVDDFGNVVRVVAPWNAGSGSGETRYEYDAAGNLTKKQTQEMRDNGTGSWLEYSYDSNGRLLEVNKKGYGGTMPLYYLGYDNPLLETGCPATTNVKGRLAYREDSFGRTWYSYDQQGHVVDEIRQRAGTYGSCSGDLADNPSTHYTYSGNGVLTGITYPYGREVSYVLGTGGLEDRVDHIDIKLFLGGTWVTRPLVRAVRWEPYGGLRSYEFMSGEESGNPNTVEYFLGNAVESEPADESCEGLSLDEGVPDGTGRPRGVFASTGGGGTSGDILKQLYTWNAEHLVQQSTCFTGLGQAKAHVQGYSYRNTGELAAVTGVNIPTRTNGSGTSQNRSYSYDRRGNRSGATIDGCPRTYVPYASPSADLLYLNVPDGTSGCVNRFSGYTQEYSADGQLNRIGTAWWWWWTDFGYAPEATGGALSSVVKSALVQPANLSHLYYFDAFGRRRLKDIANLWQEESFHDLGLQELTSTAPDGYAMSDVLITDDYVWLDGRVIAMVRGRFIDWRRRNEDSTDCDREAEEGHCGIFHIINDQLPKPIAMLESETEGFTNAALYDEFGWMNRIPLISGFAYSPGANTAGVVSVPDTGHIHARALYNYVDLPPSSHLRMNGVASFTGSQLAHEWSDLADLGNTSSITLATTSVSGSCSTCEGVQTEAVEYFRHTPGVPPMWLPFRFPGQRYDPETDMMSNGARTYEPNTGRYLQPEPLAQDPNLFVRPARNLGMGAPVYTYALGSPILVSDRTGLAATTLEPCLLRPDCAYMMAEAGIIALGQAGLAVCVVAAAAAGTANMCAAAQSSRPVSYSRPLNPGEPIAWSPPVLWKPITSSPSKPWVAAEITEADVTDLAPGECKLIAPEPGEWFCEYHCRTPGGKPERRQRFRNLSGSGDDGCWGKLDYSDTVPYKGY
jgi:RHS repeat-associated protein